MRMTIPALFLALAACGGEAIEQNDGAATRDGRAASQLSPSAVPVRIGELGPNFPACNAVGAIRRAGDAAIPVRAAPFEAADRTGEAAGRFFICARSLDQKWFGIVYGGDACGVSAPVPRRVEYAGPCRSGWVSSALVRLVAGRDGRSLQGS